MSGRGGRIERRAVLAAGGALGAAGALAACAGPGSQAATPSGTSRAASPASSTSTDGGSSSAGALAGVSDIPVGGGMVFDASKVVVTQPEAGAIKGFTAVCPHQGCLVSSVADNEIECACHGSFFSAVDGSVLRGPATQGLAEAAVTVESGEVYLA